MGIAHRDLKPANLFCAAGTSGPSLRVLDFGIAKAIDAGSAVSHQATGTSKGVHAFSPQYAAPEQFRPAVFGSTGTWTDVHAVGLLLVELVAGRPALAGGTAFDFYEACLTEKRPTPRTLGIRVTDPFEAICRTAIQLAPADRFRDAGELLSALDRALGVQTSLPAAIVGTMGDALRQCSSPGRVTPSTDPWMANETPATNRCTAQSDPAIVYTPHTSAQTELSSSPEPGAYGAVTTPPTEEMVEPPPRRTVPDPVPAVRRERSRLASILGGAFVLALLAGGGAAAWMRPWAASEAELEDPIFSVTLDAPAQSILLPYETAEEEAGLEEPPAQPPPPPAAPTVTKPRTPPPATTTVSRRDAGAPVPSDAGGVATDASSTAAEGGTPQGAPACAASRYGSRAHKRCCGECNALGLMPCVPAGLIPIGLTCEKLSEEVRLCQQRCDNKAR